MSADLAASFLVGCVAGALGVFTLTGLALWFLEWRQVWREGNDE